MKNQSLKKTEKKLTPHEFWTSVKMLAELKINQAKVNSLMGSGRDNEFSGASVGSRLIDREAISVLEEIIPGSVVIDDDNKTITLIGWDLEQFDNSDNDHCQAQNIHKDTKETWLSEVTAGLSSNPTKIIKVEPGLQGVINPFADTPQSTPERNQCRCGCRVSRESSGPVNQEHKESTRNEDLVPVIKRKFGDRVFHMLSRLMFWNK